MDKFAFLYMKKSILPSNIVEDDVISFLCIFLALFFKNYMSIAMWYYIWVLNLIPMINRTQASLKLYWLSEQDCLKSGRFLETISLLRSLETNEMPRIRFFFSGIVHVNKTTLVRVCIYANYILEDRKATENTFL